MIDVQQLFEHLKRWHPAADDMRLLTSLKQEVRSDPALAEAIIADWIKTYLNQLDFGREDMIETERRLLPLD